MFYLLFAILLLSGSVFGAAFFKKRFEETLPLTCFAVILISYLFGLLQILNASVIFVAIVLVLLYPLSFFWADRKGELKALPARLLTPGFAMFALAFFFFALTTRNLLAINGDEYSHWMDCVKAMIQVGDFVTSPESESIFQSYPPAMALFQFFAQKLAMFAQRTSLFHEGIMHFTFRLLSFSLFLPFTKTLKFKKPLPLCGTMLCFLLLPLPFFNYFYCSMLIDPFVATVGGCALAAVLLRQKEDWVEDLYVILSCAVCVLAKDVGFAFALIVALAYFSKRLLLASPRKSTKKENAKLFSFSLLPMLATLFAKFSWKIEIATSNAVEKFDAPVDMLAYTKMFFFKNDETYRQDVVNSFKEAFFTQTLNIGHTNITLNFATLFVVISILLFLAYRYKCSNNEVFAKQKRGNLPVLGLVMLIFVLYIYTMGATYVYKFSEYEATNLASYQRYLGIIFLFVWTPIVLLLLSVWNDDKPPTSGRALAVLLAVLIAISPTLEVYRFVDGYYTDYSQRLRENYEPLNQLILSNCDGNDKIYFIAQERAGYDRLIVKFLARPNTVADVSNSIGQPFYEGDIWTETLSAEQWRTRLLEENYDFVALYYVNAYFIETYACLFTDPNDIQNSTLFRVNRETGLLERCL